MNKTLPNNGDYLPWVIEQIKAINQATGRDEFEYDPYELAAYPDAPPVSVQRAIIFRLAHEKAIEILDTKEQPTRDGRLAIEVSGFEIKILPHFDELFSDSTSSKKQEKVFHKKITIDSATLDEENYLVKINDGEDFIPFYSKPEGKGLAKENKQFKVLVQLWEYRWEIKNGKVLKTGDVATLENLKRNCGCPTIDAAYRHTRRLNTIFENHGVTMKIECEAGVCRLIIDKS